LARPVRTLSTITTSRMGYLDLVIVGRWIEHRSS
jgi:hypothetical protein